MVFEITILYKKYLRIVPDFCDLPVLNINCQAFLVAFYDLKIEILLHMVLKLSLIEDICSLTKNSVFASSTIWTTWRKLNRSMLDQATKTLPKINNVFANGFFVAAFHPFCLCNNAPRRMRSQSTAF